jgi:hypothetical protein
MLSAATGATLAALLGACGDVEPCAPGADDWDVLWIALIEPYEADLPMPMFEYEDRFRPRIPTAHTITPESCGSLDGLQALTGSYGPGRDKLLGVQLLLGGATDYPSCKVHPHSDVISDVGIELGPRASNRIVGGGNTGGMYELPQCNGFWSFVLGSPAGEPYADPVPGSPPPIIFSRYISADPDASECSFGEIYPIDEHGQWWCADSWSAAVVAIEDR